MAPTSCHGLYVYIILLIFLILDRDLDIKRAPYSTPLYDQLPSVNKVLANMQLLSLTFSLTSHSSAYIYLLPPKHLHQTCTLFTTSTSFSNCNPSLIPLIPLIPQTPMVTTSTTNPVTMNLISITMPLHTP